MVTIRRSTSPSHLSGPAMLSPTIAGDLNARHVTGHYELLDGTPVQGTVTFAASTVLLDENSDLILMPESFVATLDSTGAFDILLPVTDDPDITPVGWTYDVTEAFSNAVGRPKYSIMVPYDGGNDADISIWSVMVPASGGDGSGSTILVADATGTVKGILKLTGDLGGTADAPTVPGLATKADAAATTAALNAKADLVGGVIPTAQMPSLSLTTAVPVADQAAMLALTPAQVQPGDLALRADGAGTWMLMAADPSVLGNWLQLPDVAGGGVTSVNGQTGVVVLAKADIGLANVDNTADANKNVLSAIKLTTPRTIDGQAFDGTANITVIAPGTHAAASKTTPVDADELPVTDSASSFGLKRLTWANLKATLKTYLDTLYSAIGHTHVKTYRVPHTFSYKPPTASTTAGDQGFFWASAPAGQAVNLKGLQAGGNGASLTFKVMISRAAGGGWVDVSAAFGTTASPLGNSATVTGQTVAIADGDAIGLFIIGAGTNTVWNCSLYFDYAA